MNKFVFSILKHRYNRVVIYFPQYQWKISRNPHLKITLKNHRAPQYDLLYPTPHHEYELDYTKFPTPMGEGMGESLHPIPARIHMCSSLR